jgi:hypothetical protein
MAGTPEKMLEHLLDSRLDNKNETEIGKPFMLFVFWLS